MGWSKDVTFDDLEVKEVIKIIENQEYPLPKYKLIAKKQLEEVCRGKTNCAHTIKRWLSSDDGFYFEIYHSDGNDSVWCDIKDLFPCSTIGDTGAGKDTLHIIDKVNNKKKVIISGSGGRINRITAPIDFPYLLLANYSGGSRCCFNYYVYLKENINLDPFIIESSRSDYFYPTKNNRLFFAGWKEIPERNKVKIKEPYFIEDIVINHFNKQHGEQEGEELRHDVSMDDLVERDGLYYEVYSDDIFIGDVVVGKEQGKVIKGKREGEWLEYYKNGEVKEKSNFKDGKAEGESIVYYDNGKLRGKGNYKDGKAEGEIFSYFENGESELIANFKDGKLEGEFLSYYKNGQLKEKSNYKDGKAEGEHLSYYENGQLEKIEIYKDDELIKTVSESDSEVSEAEENYRKRIIKNSKKHQSDKLKKKGLHKYWNHNSNTISPECFPYEWYSGDNFEHIAEHFSIQYNDDFSKNTGKYFGKEILNFEGIPEPWTKGKYKLYIIRNLDTCSYVEDEIYEYGDHVTYTNPNPEMHIDQIKYEIVEDISLKLCQELAPNFDATCVKSSIFTIGRWQGGSRGFAWMTYIYGLFETKNTKKYIIPLKSWFGLSEKEALDFYSQWDDRSKVDLEN